MELHFKFQGHEKYKDVFLPFVSALAAAHIIICYKRPDNPFKIILANGYFVDLCVNFLFALLVFFAINLISLTLDHFYSWEHKKWSRLWLQFLLGIIGTMTLSVIVAATYFAKNDQDISETDFFDAVFWMILGYVVTINMFYNACAIADWKYLGNGYLPKLNSTSYRALKEPIKIVAATPAENEVYGGALKPGTKAALLQELKKHDVILFYTAKDKAYAKLVDGSTMEWKFRVCTTLKVLECKLYCRVTRYHVVRRDAIAQVIQEPQKDVVTIILKSPYNDKIRIGNKFTDEFYASWYNEGE